MTYRMSCIKAMMKQMWSQVDSSLYFNLFFHFLNHIYCIYLYIHYQKNIKILLSLLSFLTMYSLFNIFLVIFSTLWHFYFRLNNWNPIFPFKSLYESDSNYSITLMSLNTDLCIVRSCSSTSHPWKKQEEIVSINVHFDVWKCCTE